MLNPAFPKKKDRSSFKSYRAASPLFAFTLIFAAIVLKLLLTYYFFVVDTDKLFQALAAKNLVEGNGLTIQQVHADHLNQEIFEPLSWWPPGYSLLLAPIFAATHSLSASCFIIDIISTIIFFIVIWKLLVLLKFPGWTITLLILFNALYISEYIVYSTATDLIGVDFCLLTIYYSIKGFRKKFTTGLLIVLACCNIMPAILRYMYIPAPFVVPLLLWWNGNKLKKPDIKKAANVTFLVSVFAVLTLLTFQKLYTGTATYAGTAARGFFPSNMKMLHAVVLSSFLNLQFYSVQLSQLSGRSYQFWLDIFRELNFVPFIIIIIVFLVYLVKTRCIIRNEWQGFLISTGLMCIVTFSVLVYLSLVYDTHLPGGIWTYISDRRYYILATIFLPVVAMRILFLGTYSFYGIKIIRAIFVLVLVVEIGHGLYFLEKNFSFDRRNNVAIVQHDNLIAFAKKTVMENKPRNIDVVFVGNSSIANSSTEFGGKALVTRTELNTEKLEAVQPTLLIVILDSIQRRNFGNFLNQNPAKYVKRIGKYDIYSLNVH